MDYNQTVKELTLMLLYLTSWKEREPFSSQRSWKGYDFGVLNKLVDDGLISDSKRSKSVVLYGDAISMAKELMQKYGLNPGADD